jgi:hypothetical protein
MKNYISILLLILISCSDSNTKSNNIKISKTINGQILATSKTTRIEDTSGNDNLEFLYQTAIGEFIRLAKKDLNQKYDTIYFGKHQYRNSDDYPNINLPQSIENTKILIIAPKQGEEIQRKNPSKYYINLVSWIDSSKAEFNFVVFSKGFRHQYDCKLRYEKQKTNSKYILKKYKFEINDKQ